MKCIHCANDVKHRDRKDGRCPNCKHRFAFEPQNGDPMTDALFATAIARVSSGGPVRFTADQLYREVRRRHSRSLGGYVLGRFIPTIIGTAIVAVPTGGLVGFRGALIVVGLSTAIFFAWLIGSSGIKDRRRFPRDQFDALLRRYTDAHGMPKAMIERKEWTPRRVPLIAQSEEMLAYSFDRAVICDRAETVDFLIANQFHFENNCAVLGVHNYPGHAFDTVRAMLRNNPKLVVVALHDATVEGCKLAHRLRNDPAWFKDGVPVIDIGLRPAHHRAFNGQEDRNELTLRVEPGEGISAAEARWLERFSLALAVVIPEQVIKRLFRAITLAEDKQESGDGGGGGSSSSDTEVDMSSEADASDGGGDSFG